MPLVHRPRNVGTYAELCRHTSAMQTGLIRLTAQPPNYSDNDRAFSDSNYPFTSSTPLASQIGKFGSFVFRYRVEMNDGADYEQWSRPI